MGKLISIVIPAYNENQNLDELYRRITLNIAKIQQYDFEIIIVENGSSDRSIEKLVKFNHQDKRFKIIQLSRNFGCDNALSVGLLHAKGDAAILMNADLQDPPEMISQFIEKWEEGNEIVYGIVKKRIGTGFFRRISTQIFYKFINFLTKGLFPKNASDFRIIDKQVYQLVNQMGERNRFLRGMIAWTGFRQASVSFDRPARFSGKSKATFGCVFNIALNGIFSFSYFPLRLITILGVVLSICSCFLLFVYVFLFFTMKREMPGFTTLITVSLFMFGIQFFMLGIMGEYVGRIYEESKQRPNYIIKDTYGF